MSCKVGDWREVLCAGAAPPPRLATMACFLTSEASPPAVSLKFLQAIRARRDPAAPMPDPRSPEFAPPPDASEDWTTLTKGIASAGTAVRSNFLEGFVFVYRRPLSEEAEPHVRRTSSNGPSMDNLRLLCAPTDEVGRCRLN